MAKHLPPELRDFYFSFDWNLDKLWALPVSMSTFTVASLQWHMDIPIWSSKIGNMLFDLHPRTVLDNPGKYPRHDFRMEMADLDFPIDIMESCGRFVIIDGVHRLAKAIRMETQEIKTRVIPRELIPLFAIEA